MAQGAAAGAPAASQSGGGAGNPFQLATNLYAEKNNQGILHLTRKIRWNFLLLDQKYYTALRNFFQTVRTDDDQQILLQPSAASAAPDPPQSASTRASCSSSATR